MDKKKRPPPGATLIQRLREARLRREEAEAGAQGKKQQDGEPGHASGQAAQGLNRGVTREAPAAKAALEGTVPAAVKKKADFIRRAISIDDLRPHTDDYGQLTDEIRLAGRFAAAGLIAQGLRLARLKDEALYKAHYGTFEEYCRTEHSMSATYAYRLIRMAEMAERIAEDAPAVATGKDAGAISGAPPAVPASGAAGKPGAAGTVVELMPDPFAVMLGLGHRHLMALLPLEPEAAEDLLIRGVPLPGESGKSAGRIPIGRASEQQIRRAISLVVDADVALATRGVSKKAPPAVPRAGSARTMSDLLEILHDWALWLESRPQGCLLVDRIGEGREIGRLARQFKKVGDRIVEALGDLHRHKK